MSESNKKIADKAYNRLLMGDFCDLRGLIGVAVDEGFAAGYQHAQGEDPWRRAAELENAVAKLESRHSDHLRIIADMSRNSIDQNEAEEMRTQIAVMIARIGTLRTQLRRLGDACKARGVDKAWTALKPLIERACKVE